MFQRGAQAVLGWPIDDAVTTPRRAAASRWRPPTCRSSSS
jgi:hypothetical protein